MTSLPTDAAEVARRDDDDALEQESPEDFEAWLRRALLSRGERERDAHVLAVEVVDEMRAGDGALLVVAGVVETRSGRYSRTALVIRGEQFARVVRIRRHLVLRVAEAIERSFDVGEDLLRDHRG